MRKIIIFCMSVWILTACKTKYITVETVRTDTTYITKHQRDSIWLHDSIHVKEYMKGDTVYVEHLKWVTKYIETRTTDTIYQATHDTVPEPYPVTEYVEKKLSKWQKLRMRAGEAAMGLSGILIILGILKLKNKLL